MYIRVGLKYTVLDSISYLEKSAIAVALSITYLSDFSTTVCSGSGIVSDIGTFGSSSDGGGPSFFSSYLVYFLVSFLAPFLTLAAASSSLLLYSSSSLLFIIHSYSVGVTYL